MSDLVADYDYTHPPEAVAQVPAARREDARLLVVQREALERRGELRPEDGTIAGLERWLHPGDLLVVNEARVAPARLAARRLATGGRVSVLVLQAGDAAGLVLLGTRGRLQPGELLEVAGDRWRIERAEGEGRFAVAVEAGRPLPRLLEEAGRMPLPPYIERGREVDPRDALDRERYQTTFAAGEGPGEAAAAPTAGLHLTAALLERLRLEGVELGRLRLAVGPGTFTPLRGTRLDEHVMHAEEYLVPTALAQAWARARQEGRRVVAVGTTVVRALESAVDPSGTRLAAGRARTSLFIRPGHRFRAVDALLTNFHQPRSTLLVLVSAFAGRRTIRAAYEHALARGYRLFSYGDAMLLADDDPSGPPPRRSAGAADGGPARALE